MEEQKEDPKKEIKSDKIDTRKVKKVDNEKKKTSTQIPERKSEETVKTGEAKEVKASTEKEEVVETKKAKEVKASTEKEEVVEAKKAKEVKASTEKEEVVEAKKAKEVKASTEKEEVVEAKKAKEVKTSVEKEVVVEAKKAKEVKTSVEKEVVVEAKKAKEVKASTEKEVVVEEKKAKEVKTSTEKEEVEAKKAKEVKTSTEKEEVEETPKEDVTEVNNSQEEVNEVAYAEDIPKERPVLPADFNWSDLDSKGFGDTYTEEEINVETSFYKNTLTTVSEKVVVDGKVVAIIDRDVVINIGFKSDGTVSLSEFRDVPDLKAGDTVQVYVEEHENQAGELVLSRKKAKVVYAWDTIKKSYESDEVIRGYVKRRTKGGLIVDIFGIESFLPGSQVDVKPIRDFDIYVDKEIEVKVVKINYVNDNVVVSHKVLIEKDLEKQKVKIINNLEKGQILGGTVKNMTNFGVFVDLGGVDGLLHITDISWRRISHPDEILELDQKIKVVVLEFDENRKRISLGMKQLEKHPWDDLDEDLIIGSKVKGAIVNVTDYGVFLEIQKGVEGLIHVSEMSWSQHLRNPQEFFKIGDKLEAVVLTLDKDAYKMSLGVKQLTEDPWTTSDLVKNYAIGTKHNGVVRNLTTFGLFLELEEGIDGLVHISDLSWTKKIRHPHEFIRVGEELEVQVLDLDVDKRKLALGHKQLEENPWDTFEDFFVIGSTHKCVVDAKNDKGAILELPYGLHGFAPARTLKKEDGKAVEVGESLEFVVIDFNKEDRKIYLSHQATYSKVKRMPNKHKEVGRLKRKINKESETSTLGDIPSLIELKEKMNKSNDEKKGKSNVNKRNNTKS